jgi:hypothetical protein
MPVYKLDLIFEAFGRGWEETYYKNFAQADFASAFGVAVALAQKRIVLSAPPVRIKAYRIQDPLTVGRQGSVYYFNPEQVAVDPGGDQGAASPDTTINTTWVHNATNASRTLGLRGIWDTAVRNFNQLNTPAYATWNGIFSTYVTYLKANGFGWLSRVRLASNLAVSYSVVDPIVPVFTFPAGTFTAPADIGKFKLARFSKFNGSRSELNRELVIEVLTTTTAKVAAPISAGPMITGGRAILYDTPVFLAADVIGVTRVGRRAPGAPLLYTPGRARNRPRT